MIALATDSASQIPRHLRSRYSVHVLPVIVTIDGEAHHEGVDLSPDFFYEQLARGAEVSTSAPSVGEAAAFFRRIADAGADEILSINVGSNLSGTFNAIRLGARASPVSVRQVDTQTVSFPVACCVWAAGEVLRSGGDAESAAEAATRVAQQVGTVFVVGATDLAARSGRVDAEIPVDGTAVIATDGPEMSIAGSVSDLDAAVDSMTDHVAEWSDGRPLLVGVGDALAPDVGERYARRLRRLSEVVDLVRYEIGPSVGAHLGAGTVGACFFPAALAERPR